jgi:hypothetical protein
MPPLIFVSRRLLSIVSAASAIAIASPALAQSGQPTQAGAPAARNGIRLGAPAGSYIAARMESAEINSDRAASQDHEGKRISFTPVRTTESLDEAAQGYVIGVLETEVEGGDTGLPPGRYTIFAKNVGGEWEAFAESGGTVVKQALQVTAEDAEAPKPGSKTAEPRFSTSEGGWCWTTGPYPAPTSWGRYDSRGYWHYYPVEWGRHQTLTVCW